MIEKVIIRVKAFIGVLFFKFRFGSRVHMCFFNPIRGNFRIDLGRKSELFVGRSLMSMGPLNIKVCDDATLQIGDNCFFNHNVSITCSELIRIGDSCNFANNVVIVDHDHIITDNGVQGNIQSSPVEIGDRVWIGSNAVITRGVQIGDGAVVGAGAVVTKDIPQHEVWGGCPAKKIRAI